MLLIIVGVSLSGCATQTINACPQLPHYTEEFKDELANEVEGLKNSSALLHAMLDYVTIIEELEECQ